MCTVFWSFIYERIFLEGFSPYNIYIKEEGEKRKVGKGHGWNSTPIKPQSLIQIKAYLMSNLPNLEVGTQTGLRIRT